MHPTRQFETAVCGGSNLKAPMKLDFLRSLCAQERHAWPEVVLCRVEGEPLPVCCLSEAAAGDPFARIGIVTAPSEALTALLRTAPVRARVTALCDSAGEPCDGGAPDVWGFLAEYRCGDPLSGAVRAAIDGAAARGCASPEALTARAEYLLEQAVPEPIILRVFAEMFSLPEYPELVPDPLVRYVQADGFGALTRCLAYRLSGMHLRLVGSKGCGKNTLIQTVDWLLNVPQYRMQGNAELDKLDLLGGPTIENGTMRYRLSDMLRYLAAGADVVLDEGNTIKPECADVLHSLTDAARQIHDHDERGLCRHELHERGDDRPLHAHPHCRAGEHRRCAAPRRARGERRQPEYLRLCLLCHPRPHPQRRRARAGRDDDPRLY